MKTHFRHRNLLRLGAAALERISDHPAAGGTAPGARIRPSAIQVGSATIRLGRRLRRIGAGCLWVLVCLPILLWAAIYFTYLGVGGIIFRGLYPRADDARFRIDYPH